MKKMIQVLALCSIIASCSNKEAHSKSMQQAIQLPPDMHSPDKYLKLDTSLLASATDLSCGMNIKGRTADTMRYKGRLYGFCGTGCKEDFAKDPLSHLNK